MKYRGIHYQASAPSLEMTVTEKPGIFLGNSFTLRQVQAPRRSQTPELKYRGVSYS